MSAVVLSHLHLQNRVPAKISFLFAKSVWSLFNPSFPGTCWRWISQCRCTQTEWLIWTSLSIRTHQRKTFLICTRLAQRNNLISLHDLKYDNIFKLQCEKRVESLNEIKLFRVENGIKIICNRNSYRRMILNRKMLNCIWDRKTSYTKWFLWTLTNMQKNCNYFVTKKYG